MTYGIFIGYRTVMLSNRILRIYNEDNNLQNVLLRGQCKIQKRVYNGLLTIVLTKRNTSYSAKCVSEMQETSPLPGRIGVGEDSFFTLRALHLFEYVTLCLHVLCFL